MKRFKSVGLIILFNALAMPFAWAQDNAKPNVVFMMMDNLGWGEIGVYGGGALRGAETPRLDALAAEGTRLLNFNVEPQCTPTRSALMTGRHPIRSGTTKVVWGLPYGLVGWEVTIAELMSEAGYRTGMFGKWHLGEQEGRYPTDQGFDSWYGIANTTDESQYTSQFGYDPEVVKAPKIVEAKRGETPVAVKDYNLSTRPLIDRELTERAIDFMEQAKDAGDPFFLYLPYTQSHLPAIPHPDFEGKTGNGRWADMLAEVDHNAGQVLDAIDRLGLRDNTIVIWTSDNGPEEAPNHFGTAGYWRGFYFTTLEGSLRTPFLIRWPGHVPEGGVSNEIVHMVDMMPTLANAAGFKVPDDRMIDGVDQLPFFTGQTEKSAREGFPAYNGSRLQSYKWRNFKVHYWKQDSMFDTPVAHNFPRVHNLIRDPKELFGITGGANNTGAQNLTWVFPAVTERVLEFQQSLKDEPPVPFPAPEPYTPDS
ncbi:arylsulfatase [Marinobacter sp. BGYM27]|uniref:arylsulfatase n=1 Tax=unclassified Marinobacter TaxID=83889 RepID=UPI0021A8A1A7|nr:arylsulfatase [Marinobacter sp. BGYM27]MDG5499633.1 arylsulfatase [Marinobacter sp. BGYM27]